MMDTRELEELMKQYTALVYAVVAGILGHDRKADVEEVVSDVFYAFWKADKYDISGDGAKKLLITIARRQAINRLKQQGRRCEEELDREILEAGLVDEKVIQNMESESIRKVLSSLDPLDSKIFTLRYYWCQSVKEIARAIGVKPKYVENRLYSCKKLIRKRLLACGITHEGGEYLMKEEGVK